MEIQSKYSPKLVENKWYAEWLSKGYFGSRPDARESYTIVIPPPNVTGVLHMGHMLNNTIQDILVRRARMMGKNACWIPGTDHASIATEAKVVAKLKAEGIDKTDLTRDKFLEHAWEWKNEYGDIILEQLKKLGASCDWDRTAFTMDKDRSKAVIKSFVELFNKGLVYRGVRMVNWDPEAQTAVSDEEVIYREEQSKLYYLRYKIEGDEDSYVIIATTRPETILGDTAVCVNPNDERFKHLKGKRVIVPLVNRSVPIIEDEYVDMEFGTGCLKITPAHDINDYEIGMRHNLDSISIFNDDGTLSESAQFFVGIDRFEARKQILPELEKAGNFVRADDYVNKLGCSERTNAVIEPKLSAQWFIKMKDLAKPALENVENDTIKFHPPKFKNLYRHWMENIKDWCISRQLWWGHRIPVYYLADGSFVVAETPELALEAAKEKLGDNNISISDLKQDEDVLDTWASSWLWPFSVFPDDEQDYYFPTSDLVTAPDIIFFWVARMIIAGYEFKGNKPFENVYFTGMVRDKQGRKMSKSLGNSPDPLELIEKYGADGVRVGMLLCSPAGNDILFDESLTEQGRNFSNKIWNAFRLVKGWDIDANGEQSKASKAAIEWFDNKLNKTLEVIEDHFSKFRISDALMVVYTMVRDDFSGLYLEGVKPAYQKPIDKTTYDATIGFFDKVVRILHPFVPFISEEIYQLIEERKEGDSIMISEMPKSGDYDNELLSWMDNNNEVITAFRKIRIENKIKLIDKLELFITPQKKYNSEMDSLLMKVGGFSGIFMGDCHAKVSAGYQSNFAHYEVPINIEIDVEGEKKRLEGDLKYQEGFIHSVQKKLSNDRFVNNAPEAVVKVERQKLADSQIKIKTIKEQISKLG